MMRLHIAFLILPLVGPVATLSHTVPWLVLSTSKLKDAINQDQIQSFDEVLEHTKDILSTCPTDRYLVVTQAGIHATDMRWATGSPTTYLCRAAQSSRIRSKFSVAEVLGKAEYVSLAQYIRTKCSNNRQTAMVMEAYLTPFSPESKAVSSREHREHISVNKSQLRDGAYDILDGLFASNVEGFERNESYTLIILPNPREPAYEVESGDSLHMDLKRDGHPLTIGRQETDRKEKRLALFQKYQFFTPGVFMFLFVAFILLPVLSIGLRALSGLEVSYGVFEKEMGPAAHKRQQ